jgi:hypothetical protein
MATPFPDCPFAPAPPTPAQLQAYAEGRLPPAEHNAVERALESDPLLRDALEGLQHPQATAGWRALQRQRPGAGGRASLWIAGSVLLAVLVLASNWKTPKKRGGRMKPDGQGGYVWASGCGSGCITGCGGGVGNGCGSDGGSGCGSGCGGGGCGGGGD